MPRNTFPELPDIEPDDGIDPVTHDRPPSFTAWLTCLKPGQTASRAVPMDPSMTMREWADIRAEVRRELRNNSAASIRRARIKTGGDYSTEIADSIMPSGKLFIILIVTRIS